MKLWNRRRDYNRDGDRQFVIPLDSGTHGGADTRIVAEFVRYLRQGGPVATSPIAARNSVAAGYMAALSLRGGSGPMDVPPIEEVLRRYFRANWV